MRGVEKDLRGSLDLEFTAGTTDAWADNIDN